MKNLATHLAKEENQSGAGGLRLLHHMWLLLKEQLKQPFYTLYQHRLEVKARSWNLPLHVGIIMDGNRRYARRSGLLNVNEGHALGADKLLEVVRWCFDMDISVVTVWGLSLDNLNRDPLELKGLLDLMETRFQELVHHEDVHRYQVRIRYIGKRGVLPESLGQAVCAAEEATAHYDSFVLNIAVAYGGREEITEAFRSYLQDQQERGRSLKQIADNMEVSSITPYLYTAGQPEPDLIIRTSGETRLSGFLLWQSAYSEYYFCDTYWPVFRKIDFLRALRSYSQRQRRMGR